MRGSLLLTLCVSRGSGRRATGCLPPASAHTHTHTRSPNVYYSTWQGNWKHESDLTRPFHHSEDILMALYKYMNNPTYSCWKIKASVREFLVPGEALFRASLQTFNIQHLHEGSCLCVNHFESNDPGWNQRVTQTWVSSHYRKHVGETSHRRSFLSSTFTLFMVSWIQRPCAVGSTFLFWVPSQPMS